METEHDSDALTARRILDTLVQHREFLKALSVRTIGLFGSYSRGEATQDSDIDILVTFDNTTFDNYAKLYNFLEDEFGRDVDLVIARSIRSALRPYILEDVLYATGV